MAGQRKVISGLMNKVQVTTSNVLPDELVAAKVPQESKPADGNESAK